jgi:hypothetical protein
MGQYSKKGLYSGYDKNHKERQAEDYYATPPAEVTNILQTLGLPKNEQIGILEPCCGGGHMVEGILRYFDNPNILATDIKERENPYKVSHFEQGVLYYTGEDLDFLSEEYPCKKSGIVIMNPPFSIAIPFILHGLEIATDMLIVFGRTKLVETKKRYEEIFSKYPPTDIYQYIDRVACAKNGDFENLNGIEAHAWFIWDKHKMKENYDTKFHWLWSVK